MAKSRPSEEDLGISTTAEEKAILEAPPADDYPEGGDPELDAQPEVNQPEPPAEPVKTEQPRPEPPPEGYVDKRALSESRAREKLLEERMNVLLDVVNRTTQPKEPQPEAPARPDLKTDPMEFIGHVAQRLDAIEGATAEQQAAWEAAETERQQTEAAWQVASPQFNEAAASDPTVMPTYSALRIALGREFAWQQRINFDTATPAQQKRIIDYVNEFENAHVRWAVQHGVNIVEHLKGFAAARGINPATLQQPAPTPNPKTIDQRRQAQQRHQSLSDAPGSEVPAKLTAKDIAKMSPKQFAALAAKIGDAGLDELMGPGGTA